MADGLLSLLDNGGLHLGGLLRVDGLCLLKGCCKPGDRDFLVTVLNKRDWLRNGDLLDLDLLGEGDGDLREDLLCDCGDLLGGRLNGLSLLSLGDGLR